MSANWKRPWGEFKHIHVFEFTHGHKQLLRMLSAHTRASPTKDNLHFLSVLCQLSWAALIFSFNVFDLWLILYTWKRNVSNVQYMYLCGRLCHWVIVFLTLWRTVAADHVTLSFLTHTVACLCNLNACVQAQYIQLSVAVCCTIELHSLCICPCSRQLCCIVQHTCASEFP